MGLITEEGKGRIMVPLDFYEMMYDKAPGWAQLVMKHPDDMPSLSDKDRDWHLAWWFKILLVLAGTTVAVIAVNRSLRD